jgi:hypothetical protein
MEEKVVSLEDRRAIARQRINALGTTIKMFGHVELCEMLGLRLPRRKRVRKKVAKQYVAGMARSMLVELALSETPKIESYEWDILELKRSRNEGKSIQR